MKGRELEITDHVWGHYNESLSYNIYILDLPFLCEDSPFEVAVTKIWDLNDHPSFVSSGTKIQLIGLVEKQNYDNERVSKYFIILK